MREVINVDKLYKVYKFNNSILSLFRKVNKLSNINQKIVLDDISFTVYAGEAFGIIGKNGAGKSTLLQIITGTLKETSGFVHVNGRISALLELGSGFNPDFTGKENIYLSGSILGISKSEMDLKVSEIEAFADIGDYINKPVRTYSTGMLMRVAFSVAVAVEPDVLIIDEALSVGDLLFQQKCNMRLRELISKGVTLLVVTHDTSFVVNICNRAVWLDEGKIKYLGNAGECVKEYVTYMTASSTHNRVNSINISAKTNFNTPTVPSVDLSNCKSIGNPKIYINRLWLINSQGEANPVFRVGEWCKITIAIRTTTTVHRASAGCEIRDRHGQVIFANGLRVINQLIESITPSEERFVCIRFKLDIAPGQYSLDVGCGAGENDTNVWQRLLAVSVLEVINDPSDQVVHGIAKLPCEIDTY
jgi:lipopolysaccharide transport system ATP-binding protein